MPLHVNISNVSNRVARGKSENQALIACADITFSYTLRATNYGISYADYD